MAPQDWAGGKAELPTPEGAMANVPDGGGTKDST